MKRQVVENGRIVYKDFGPGRALPGHGILSKKGSNLAVGATKLGATGQNK